MARKSFGAVVLKGENRYLKITYKDQSTGKFGRKYFLIDPTQKQPLKTAEKEARKWLDNYEAGLITNADLTLQEWLKIWLETYCQPQRADGTGGNINQKTYEGYKLNIRRISTDMGGYKLRSLNDLIISRFFATLSTEEGLGRNGVGLSRITIKNVRRVLITALNRAVKSGYILRNPAEGTKTPPATDNPDEKVRAMTEEQLRSLLMLAKEKASITYLSILIAASTGMRIGEIFGLRWSCFNSKAKTLLVNRSATHTSEKGMMLKTTKTGKSRMIEIGDDLVAALINHRAMQAAHADRLGDLYQDADLIISNDNGRMMDTPNFQKRNYRPLLKMLGLENFNFHSLRHTHASILIKHGVAINTISRRLGHSNPSTTLGIYSHLLPDSQQIAVDVMSGILI